MLFPAVHAEIYRSISYRSLDDDALHLDLLRRGFETYRYLPFGWLLEPVNEVRSGGGNTLYVRDAVRLAERVRSAPRFRFGTGGEI